MIQTIRDAEIKVAILEREIIFLKTQLNNLKNEITEVKHSLDSASNISDNSDTYDYIVAADGTQVLHRVLHIFEKIKVTALEVTGEFKAWMINVKDIFTNKIHLYNPQGVEPWTIENDSPDVNNKRVMIKNELNGDFFKLSSKIGGAVRNQLYNSCDILPIPDGSCYLGTAGYTWFAVDTNTIRIRTSLGVGPTDVGWSGTDNAVQSVSINTATLNYKDHAGVNQTLTVVTNVFVINHPGIRFVLGVRC